MHPRGSLPCLAAALLLAPSRPAPRRFAPIPEPDRVRIAEAFRLADAVGDRVWPGWQAVPFTVLLITDSTEYLVRYPSVPPGFTGIGHDSLLGSEVWARSRVFPTRLLATAPFIGGVNTIAVGQAEATGKSSTDWVLTLMHEHFHQLQYSRPGYYAGVAALDLAQGDSTGGWMLNYPFPYDSPRVAAAVDTLAAALRTAVDTTRGGFGAALASYHRAREALRRLVTLDDDRYLEFELWQEGVARYTEYAVAVAAEGASPPAAAFRALPDYQDYAAAAAGQLARLHRELANENAAANRRAIVYSLGAATALVLDRAAPQWKRHYFTDPFSLARYFPGH